MHCKPVDTLDLFRQAERMNPNVLIADLLAADRACHQTATVPYAFGDSYLYAHFGAFRRLRDELRRSGFGISKDQGRLQSCGLLVLGEMLRNHNLYAVDNLWAVERLEASRPNHYRSQDLLEVGLTGNFLTHEAAHAIADGIYSGVFRSGELAASHRLRLLRLLLAEAFANTSDFILSLEASADPFGRSFLRHNSYFADDTAGEASASAFEIRRTAGTETLNRFMTLCYLVANFGFHAATRRHLEKILVLSGVSVTQSDLYMPLFQIAMLLNKQFTARTNEVYLNSEGFAGSFRELTDFDPLDAIAEDTGLREVIGRMARILEADVRALPDRLCRDAASIG